MENEIKTTVEEAKEREITPKDVIKTVLGTAANFGAGIIVGAACTAFAPIAGAGLLAKGAMAMGKLGLAWSAGDVAEKKIAQTVDDVSDLAGRISNSVSIKMEDLPDEPVVEILEEA